MALSPRKIGEGLYQPLADINVTPLVDVMLVLLIIFMVTAPMLATGIKVNLPSAKTAQPLENKEPVVVAVAKDGSLSVGKDPVSRDELAARVKAKLGDSNGVVQLRGDRDASYGDVVSVMDELAANGDLPDRDRVRSPPHRVAGSGRAKPHPPGAPVRPRRTRRRRDRSQRWTGAVFEPPPLRPPWLRPLVIAIVIALHAAALSLVYLEPRSRSNCLGRSDRRHSAGSAACRNSGAAGRRAEAARPIRASASSGRRAGSGRAAATPPARRRSPSSRRRRPWSSNLRFPRPKPRSRLSSSNSRRRRRRRSRPRRPSPSSRLLRLSEQPPASAAGAAPAASRRAAALAPSRSLRFLRRDHHRRPPRPGRACAASAPASASEGGRGPAAETSSAPPRRSAETPAESGAERAPRRTAEAQSRSAAARRRRRAARPRRARPRARRRALRRVRPIWGR